MPKTGRSEPPSTFFVLLRIVLIIETYYRHIEKGMRNGLEKEDEKEGEKEEKRQKEGRKLINKVKKNAMREIFVHFDGFVPTMISMTPLRIQSVRKNTKPKPKMYG
jgi:hypothetical protein